MARKKPKVLTFGLDKKIRNDAGDTVDSITLEKDAKIEFFIEFTGPAFILWLVDSEGFYTSIFSSTTSGLEPERIVLGVNAGSYKLDCNPLWISALDVRVLV